MPARNTTVLDVPDDAELFAAYQSDRSNQKMQSWGQYRGWVQTFYKGNLMSDGWSEFGEVTVGTVSRAQHDKPSSPRSTSWEESSVSNGPKIRAYERSPRPTCVAGTT